MLPQSALLSFTEAERPFGERLLKLARETDRMEGYTEPHAVRMAQLAEQLGAQLGLHGVDLTALKFAALAHDLGERQMKRNYLLSPHKLSWEEMLDLWRHPILGEQAASELRLPRHTQLLIRWHQEWWNGQGYPDGLAGAHIPLGARVLRAVDSYCALTADRPYRHHYSEADAEQMLADLAGIEFDPQVVTLLLALLAEEREHHAPDIWHSAPESQVFAVAETAAALGQETDWPVAAEAEPDAFSEPEVSYEEAAADSNAAPVDEGHAEPIVTERPAEWPILMEPQFESDPPPVKSEAPPDVETSAAFVDELAAEEPDPSATEDEAPFDRRPEA